MNQLTEHSVGSIHSVVLYPTPRNEVRLEYNQVFHMLETLETLKGSGLREIDLEQLQEDLDDACWLAQWKREYVLLDDENVALAELNDLLPRVKK